MPINIYSWIQSKHCVCLEFPTHIQVYNPHFPSQPIHIARLSLQLILTDIHILLRIITFHSLGNNGDRGWLTFWSNTWHLPTDFGRIWRRWWRTCTRVSHKAWIFWSRLPRNDVCIKAKADNPEKSNPYMCMLCVPIIGFAIDLY